jgi:hypothetical protein
MKKAFLLPVLLLSLPASFLAQKIDSALSLFRKKFPTEKIYIHYNKDHYLAGETIWFKAYLTINHTPSGLSNNFYIQLSDALGKVITNKKYPVKAATVSGCIELPDSIPEGNYSVRAFTPAMLSPNADFIYSKSIPIINYSSKKNEYGVHNGSFSKFSLTFFPEGGNLIANINSVIAFKAVDEFGYPVSVKGVIKTEDGIIILPFSSYHDGIGQFRFKPQAGKKYIAVTEINGQSGIYHLPPVQSSGLELSVEDEADGKTFMVSRNKLQKLSFDVFRVVAQINNVVVYETEFYFGSNYSVKGRVSTDSLPSGILQFTVFNDDDAPILERLSFINNREYESGATLSVLNLGTKARELNSLQFDFPDTTQRSCSVTVTEFQNDAGANKGNIISSLLLTSDLKGSIYNPGFYFSDKSDSVKKAMDNLMLTHGWRRFNWKKVLHNEYEEQKIEDEFLINISGTIKNQKTKEVMTEGNLNIFISDEDSALFTYNFPVSKEGRFFLDSLLFAGSSKVYYSYTDGKGKQKPVSVILDEKKLPEWPLDVADEYRIPDHSLTPDYVGKKETSDAQKITLIQKGLENAKELENVTVLSKPKRPVDILNEKYATGVFRTGSRYTIDNITNPTINNGGGRGTVISFIKNRFPKVSFMNGHFVNTNYFNGIGGALNYWSVGVFINEFPATIAELNMLRIEQIALVKFFDAGFVGVGTDYGGGAIAIYTKKYDDIEVKNIKPTGATFFTYDGYAIEKEFYNPDYSIPSDRHKEPDHRATLCWKPAVYTNENENCFQVNFYNNDLSKKFKVVLEGFDNKGRLIFLERTIGDSQ